MSEKDLIEAIKATEEIHPPVLCIPEHELKRYEMNIDCWPDKVSLLAPKRLEKISPCYGLPLSDMRDFYKRFSKRQI